MPFHLDAQQTKLTFLSNLVSTMVNLAWNQVELSASSEMVLLHPMYALQKTFVHIVLASLHQNERNKQLEENFPSEAKVVQCLDLDPVNDLFSS